jgi:DNA-directed RNA polymerase specialized sigma24 family protein
VRGYRDDLLSERDNGLDSLRLLSNEELARVAAGGDERAARVLLERFEEPLYRYTVALVRDPDLAREATWSALFEAARAVRAGEHSDPIAPWIFRVAHTAADVAGGRPEGGVGADDEAGERAAAAGDPDRERLERLLAGLDALPARDRSSLLLRELVGLEYVGIATVTGARAAAARQSVYRARQALQGEVEPHTPHCAEIQAAMSKAETGIRERRSIALHLETCPECQAFASALETRPDDLRTLFPAPAEPLAAELVPPLPPVVPTASGGGRRGWGGRGAAAGAGAVAGRGRGPRRERGGRRRGALLPLVLVLLLVGAAIATAVALNDNGGGEHGRAAAAGGEQARGPQGGKSGGESSASKSKAKGAKPKSAKPKGSKSGAKPRVSANPSKPKAAKPSKPKGAAPGAPGTPGTAPSEPKGSQPSEPKGTGSNEPKGGEPPGAGGGQAKRARPCRPDPVASPAQSGYGNRAGVAQAEVADPCVRGPRESATGLASTGLDVALVIACGGLLLALGASLRRLGARA